MKNEMRLQGIGLVEGTEAGKIQVGDILRWNYGGLSKVISFEFSATGKTIICKLETKDHRSGKSDIYERKMRTSRLVNIVASANTNNDFNLFFTPIEEEKEEKAPEAELIEMLEGIVAKKELSRRQIEVEHVVNQIEEADDLKKSAHEVSYRVTNHGSYVDVMLFVTDIANDVTLVAQQEGEFDSMEEAETLISYLKKTGNKIEFVETMAYTG